MRADFFTKPLQGMLFYRLRDLIMNIAHMGETNNKNENPAQEAETLLGAGTTAHKASISSDITNNSTRDREWCDTHTEPTPSHNSN